MINICSGVSGCFKVERYKADCFGDPIFETRELVADWFDNLILNGGINRLGVASFHEVSSRIFVGSGNSEPDPSQTGLDDLIGSASVVTRVDGAQVSSEPFYLYLRSVARFPVGVAAGNISEIGAGWSGGMFSRSLILDEDGNPATITVLADEVLDVSYEIRLYPDTSDYTGSVEIGGVVYDYLARCANMGVISGATGWKFTVSGSSGGGSWGRNTAQAYNGLISDVLGAPTGSSSSSDSGSGGLSYDDGSFIGRVIARWGLSNGNLSGGVRSILICVGWSVWQIQFESRVDGSAIPKDSTKEMSFTVSHGWSRREE